VQVKNKIHPYLPTPTPPRRGVHCKVMHYEYNHLNFPVNNFFNSEVVLCSNSPINTKELSSPEETQRWVIVYEQL
jgi:hypothetical protein